MIVTQEGDVKNFILSDVEWVRLEFLLLGPYKCQLRLCLLKNTNLCFKTSLKFYLFQLLFLNSVVSHYSNLKVACVLSCIL
jgi:hypothetical protein